MDAFEVKQKVPKTINGNSRNYSGKGIYLNHEQQGTQAEIQGD